MERLEFRIYYNLHHETTSPKRSDNHYNRALEKVCLVRFHGGMILREDESQSLYLFFYVHADVLEFANQILIPTFYPVYIIDLRLSLSDHASDDHGRSRSKIPAIYLGSYEGSLAKYESFVRIHQGDMSPHDLILNEPVEALFIEHLLDFTRSFALCHQHRKEWHEISRKSWENICLDVDGTKVVRPIYPQCVILQLFCLHSCLIHFIEKSA